MVALRFEGTRVVVVLSLGGPDFGLFAVCLPRKVSDTSLVYRCNHNDADSGDAICHASVF
jgi:hypothetical protein